MNKKKQKILIADDEPVARKFLASVLTNAGYELVFAEDGKSAIQKASSEKPDLVLMDGLMPKMHGFLACKAIKQLKDPPRVILLTGVYTKPTYRWEAQGEFGADGLLTKPVDNEVLISEIERQLGRHRDSSVLDSDDVESIIFSSGDGHDRAPDPPSGQPVRGVETRKWIC
jgi:two-component system alkaline phosphatase synthesis response regulator PhoP